MDGARLELETLIERHSATEGMFVRVRGANLTLGRVDDDGAEDRVRLTRLGPNSYGVSVKRHTGRWERTPFTGTMADVVTAITSFMQHLVARY